MTLALHLELQCVTWRLVCIIWWKNCSGWSQKDSQPGTYNVLATCCHQLGGDPADNMTTAVVVRTVVSVQTALSGLQIHGHSIMSVDGWVELRSKLSSISTWVEDFGKAIMKKYDRSVCCLRCYCRKLSCNCVCSTASGHLWTVLLSSGTHIINTCSVDFSFVSFTTRNQEILVCLSSC